MDSQFNASGQEAEQALPKRKVVREDPEILARWVTAQQVSGVEARILELRLIRRDTRTKDLRDAIDGAIEDCDLNRAKLVEFLAPSVAVLGN